MTTRFDDAPDGPDGVHGGGAAGGTGGSGGPDDVFEMNRAGAGADEDPLAVILRPFSDRADLLGPPPGRYEAIRRTAARRRLLRAAIGAALTCAVAVLVALPLRLGAAEGPASPTVPLAPPPASDGSTATTGPRPTERPTTSGTGTPGGQNASDADPSASALVPGESESGLPEPSARTGTSKRSTAKERSAEAERSKAPDSSRDPSGALPSMAATDPATR